MLKRFWVVDQEVTKRLRLRDFAWAYAIMLSLPPLVGYVIWTGAELFLHETYSILEPRHQVPVPVLIAMLVTVSTMVVWLGALLTVPFLVIAIRNGWFGWGYSALVGILGGCMLVLCVLGLLSVISEGPVQSDLPLYLEFIYASIVGMIYSLTFWQSLRFLRPDLNA